MGGAARFRNFIRKIPYSFLVPLALVLGFSPFAPEPHLLGKIRMLFSGELARMIDVFDLLLHLTPVVLLIIKLLISGTHESESSTM